MSVIKMDNKNPEITRLYNEILTVISRVDSNLPLMTAIGVLEAVKLALLEDDE